MNAVSPGVIETPVHERYSTPQILETMRATIPMDRLGTADECAGAFLYRASEARRLRHRLIIEATRPADAVIGEYDAFVEPGNVVTRRAGCAVEPGDAAGAPPPRLPQMPAYHLVASGRQWGDDGQHRRSVRRTPRPSPITLRCCARTPG